MDHGTLNRIDRARTRNLDARTSRYFVGFIISCTVFKKTCHKFFDKFCFVNQDYSISAPDKQVFNFDFAKIFEFFEKLRLRGR